MSTTDQVKKPSRELQRLVRETVTSIDKMRNDEAGQYPGIKIKKLADLSLSSVLLRGTKEYKLCGSNDHIFEISLYRHWATCDTSREPNTSSGAMMYCTNWDTDMGTQDGFGPREWFSDLSGLIDGYAKNANALTSFLASVKRVRNFLDEVIHT